MCGEFEKAQRLSLLERRRNALKGIWNWRNLNCDGLSDGGGEDVVLYEKFPWKLVQNFNEMAGKIRSEQKRQVLGRLM